MTVTQDEDDGVLIPVEEALAMLDIQDGEVHVGALKNGILIGSDWPCAEVERVFRLVGGACAFFESKKGLVPSLPDHYLFLSKKGTLHLFATKPGAKLPIGPAVSVRP